MPLPTNGLSFALSHAGQPCTAVLGGVSSSFDGIFDNGRRVEYDDAGNPLLVLGTTLKVLTSISSQMVETVTTLTTGGVKYTVQRVMPEDDGALSSLYLAPVTA